MTPLPVTLVSGYLGAGKTTLINHLLRHADGTRLMVMVNDFGELPIDADLIESQDGNTITLANGCICCSIGADLAGAFIDLLKLDPLPDHLLIEASGVAEPHRIANIARAEPDLDLRAIIVLADAPSLRGQAEDELIGAAVHSQLAAADLVLLNKVDLTTPAELAATQKWLEEQFPSLRQLPCERANISTELLETTSSGHSQSAPRSSGAHEDQYVRWSLTTDQPLDRASLERTLDALPTGVLRLKGIVTLKNEPGAWSVQCVGPRWSISPCIESGKTRLVAIGLQAKLSPAELDELFASSRKQ